MLRVGTVSSSPDAAKARLEVVLPEVEPEVFYVAAYAGVAVLCCVSYLMPILIFFKELVE